VRLGINRRENVQKTPRFARTSETTPNTGDNQFTILCDRHHLNELGTGGLMGPVVLYREK